MESELQRDEGQAEAETRVLSRLLALFCSSRSSEAPGDGDTSDTSSAREVHQKAAETGSPSHEELEMVEALLALSPESQKSVARSLFAIPVGVLANFSPVLQFFMRVIIAVHVKADRAQAGDVEGVAGPKDSHGACSWDANGGVSCVSYELEERGEDGDAPSRSGSIVFRFPAGIQACVTANYGSVKRLKCEEVWHGDHMAYRCRTCGLSDSSCMCLGCFDPDEHEGHDYRVYRCSSGGCCDCGDPLAWKPDGFCKKHRQNHGNARVFERELGEAEKAVVELLVESTVRFCVEVMREIYLFCLRPAGGGYDSDPFGGTVVRSLPITGRRRNNFSPLVQGHLNRLEQSLAWLQMLTMSCLHYRNIVSKSFFEPLPSKFQLEPVISATRNSSRVNVNSSSSSSEEAAADMDSSEIYEASPEESSDRLVPLDVFLKAGVLLPVDMCDILGVLYLKLLFDHEFKQNYTCHFVDWYPYFIDIYLKASEENNEDGMRNLSRFIDRLFCQLFHSTAQLRELETVFGMRHTPARLRQWQLQPPLRPGASCVEWLMSFLLDKLNKLFETTFRSSSIHRRVTDETGSSVSLVVHTMKAVDCGRSVFKKRIYARLCSDLRTLLVHEEITAQAILNSFSSFGENPALHEMSLYRQLIRTFELLQQMDLQQRHVLQHVEYESQNWTFAFVADYELKLLLSAFLSGIPACFTVDVWKASECGRSGLDIALDVPGINPVDSDSFQPALLAKTLLKPLQEALEVWAHQNGSPDWVNGDIDADMGPEAQLMDVRDFYELNSIPSSSVNVKSFHLPLHHMHASLVYTLSRIVLPSNEGDWLAMLGLGDETSSDRCNDLKFWYTAIDHPLRVLLFSREIKAGLWVRNGNVMLQQLTHYHSKHWRYYGLHSDLFMCQLATIVIPSGGFTRVLIRQFPLTIVDSLAQKVYTDEASASIAAAARDEETKVEIEMNALHEATSSKEDRAYRQQLDLAEEMLRLVQQVVLTPVKFAFGPDNAADLLEREMRHWLSLGPFSRSDVIARVDLKLVDQIKQVRDHEWADLEDEEILSKVLERVGDYEEPLTKRKLSGAGLAGGGGGNLLGFGMKMSGTWKLKSGLWARVSPLFESFTPSEAQQCEQNIRKYRPREDGATSSLVLPVLPLSENSGATRVLGERVLDSENLLAVMLILLESFVRDRVSNDGNQKPAKSGGGTRVSDSLLLEALNVLYVGTQLLDATNSTSAQDVCTTLQKWSVTEVASCFPHDVSFFDKLCTDIPVGGELSASVLSALHQLHTQKSGVDDVDAMAGLIFNAAIEKSAVCRSYVNGLNRKKTTGGVATEGNEKENGGSRANSIDESTQDSKQQAREMMRRRQQMILEKMRSQQMQFLSSHGEPSAGVNKHESANDGQDESDHSSSGESDEEAEEEEEDEWGFPTGHVDVNIYLDHISSALTAMSEQSRPRSGSIAGKTRRRRSLRRNSLSVDPNDTWGSSSSRNGLGNREGDNESTIEEESEECGLCRLPCDPRSVESTFGLVGMIVPTKLTQKMGNSCNKSSEYFKSAPGLRVLLPGSNESARLQLNDAVIWSCGHSIHHTCLKSYLVSLWKQKAHRAAFELVSGDERLLCERDMEFVCPICRRLSNCLVPSVSAERLASLQPSRQLRPARSVGSIDVEELESEKEETKDDENGDDDPVAFLPWLDAQMSFRDDSPQVKRRRSRAMSSFIMRQPSMSSSSNSASNENERNVTLEREIGAFCHEIVLLCARAQLHLPLLMKGSSLDDESSVEVELQQIGSEVGAQTPAWHLLLRCLGIQMTIAQREKQLLGGDDAMVDKWQLKSMRQIAQVAVAAAAVSAHSSLAWTVIDAPDNKRFELFMAKLNGVLFGQQVLFEEKDVRTSKESASASIYSDWVDEVLVGTPLLAHPNMFACYVMRLVAKLCDLRSRQGSKIKANIIVEEMMREAFYSARVLVTAKVLQSLSCIRLDMEKQAEEEPASVDHNEYVEKTIDDFDAVESLKDAYSWISRLMARTRLVRSSVVSDCDAQEPWDGSRVEEALGEMCLPLVEQMLLLMDVMLPLAGAQSTDDVGEQSFSCNSSTPCAVCDGLHPEASSASRLDRGLRKLHLPPLRLFFHRQTFPPGQRTLCQLWGAQLESKAAVCRRARSLSGLSSPLSPTALWLTLSPASKAIAPPSMDLRAHMQQLACREIGTKRDRILMDLPRAYMDLFMRYNKKPAGLCPTCNQLPQHPGICLLCGAIVCCFSSCCEVPAASDSGTGVGECTQHAQTCGAGLGAFLLLRACTVVLFLGNERRCVWGSLYVDKNGEEDPYLRRGKALFLDPARLLALETLLVSHAYSQNTAILTNTSRRDGRRY